MFDESIFITVRRAFSNNPNSAYRARYISEASELPINWVVNIIRKLEQDGLIVWLGNGADPHSNMYAWHTFAKTTH